MVFVQPDAFVLLSLPNATIRSGSGSWTGTLNVECVTIILQDASSGREVYLIFHLDAFEAPIDPTRPISLSCSAKGRVYTFGAGDGTYSNSADIVISFPNPRTNESHLLEDFETFDSVLTQYADDFRKPKAMETSTMGDKKVMNEKEDFRGQLVLMDQDNGEIVGELDRKLRVREDPSLGENGRENEAVLIELPDEDGELLAQDVFVRAIPPGEENWMTTGASYVSYAISAGTNLFLSGLTTASNYYISNSSPSQPSTSTNPNEPAKPPLPVVFLTSASTRKGLQQVHAASGQAVKISQKTISLVESMISRAVGGVGSNAGKGKQAPSSSSTLGAPSKPALPPRRSPSPTPPAYTAEKPRLPPRPSTDSIPTTSSPPPQDATTTLSTKDRIILSASLILSTIDSSTRQILDVGTENVGRIMGHKYGPEAEANTKLLMHTGRNVVLVYIDMRGMGRRALVKKAGKEFVKGRVSSRKSGEWTMCWCAACRIRTDC
ncbi:hypothetical protein JAAARDRAFT_33259 [Jaapia argillacea MUCL 33604]|uniref:Senescence domain-containing protein n=1 Tax=Jaapia argillacea MUCL 33604 TaxID=933084 RepID=A0A067PXY2_9AGAM|nr:hypothetical protein JAAARDRAFT_33259 [Jaapia argillacea MUCL 33604]